ncbi:unnamed protein product [Bursaphelenchus xylophilus]|uniref:(pine wood nematode) hypothetical protein n=1 Tax=Bursaphelenchus xylophilus TaxID=6326 RepID=A0A1I7RR45_BURXY|nr:unnamed protein product [Bursaphelenchus xylophilus]CAG9130836.1 unnamed protein product [Bursaphelenchus xylophilus]
MIYETIVAPVLAASLGIGIICGQMGLLGLSANVGYNLGFYGFGSQFKAFLVSLIFSLLATKQLPRMSSSGLCSAVIGGSTTSSFAFYAMRRSIVIGATIGPPISALIYWFLIETRSESLKKLLFWSYNKVRGNPDVKWEM